MKFLPEPLTLVIKSAAMCTLALSLLPASAQDAATPDTHGISVTNMDKSIKPGDNFYLYCNGDWIKNTPMPADRARLSVFSALDDIANKNTAAIIEETAKSDASGNSSKRKIADLYNSYMDEKAIDAKGGEPLQPHLKAIAGITNKKELAYAIGQTLRADVDALNNTNFHTNHLFGLWVAGGFNDPDHYAPYLLQGGVQLPDREYYLSTSEHMKEVRTKYQAHVSAMLKLAGFTDTDARAEKILALEHAIAEKHLSLADNDDIHKANNVWTPADFSKNAPGLEWAEYFRGAGLSKQASFIVWQPTAFAGESALVLSEPLDTWKDWLAYHMIETTRRCCRATSPMSVSTSSARLCRARRSSARAGSVASPSSTANSAMTSAKSTRRSIFHPRRRRRRRQWSPTSLRPSANASTPSTGWPLPPRQKPSKS
jgi:endothelin-converting enzyme/putative endopeptidase